jgi:hypothetical protein
MPGTMDTKVQKNTFNKFSPSSVTYSTTTTILRYRSSSLINRITVVANIRNNTGIVTSGFCIGFASRDQRNYTWKTLQSKDTRPQISDNNLQAGSNIWSQVPQGCSIPRHTDWLSVVKWLWLRLARRLGPVSKLVHSRTDHQGSSVTSEEARTDCITSINKVVHQLISRIICVVVVIEPTPIHSIAYIHHPATPTGHTKNKAKRYYSVKLSLCLTN